MFLNMHIINTSYNLFLGTMSRVMPLAFPPMTTCIFCKHKSVQMCLETGFLTKNKTSIKTLKNVFIDRQEGVRSSASFIPDL